MPTINHPIVGLVSYQVLSGGRLKILTSQRIEAALIPELKGVPTYSGAKFSGNVLFYGPAIPQLKAAFQVVRQLGLLDKVIFWAGSFVPRLKRGGSTPSNHSFGTAFDINPEQNPFKRPPAPKGAYGSVQELLPIFRALGFECGADWKNTPDGMHFEIKRLMPQKEIAEAVAKLLAGRTPVVHAIPVKPPVPDEEPLIVVWNGNPYTIEQIIERGGHVVTKVTEKLDAKRVYVQSTPNGANK